jgi:hypothetical protein
MVAHFRQQCHFPDFDAIDLVDLGKVKVEQPRKWMHLVIVVVHTLCYCLQTA